MEGVTDVSGALGPVGPSAVKVQRLLDFLAGDGLLLTGKRVACISSDGGDAAAALERLASPAVLQTMSTRTSGASQFPSDPALDFRQTAALPWPVGEGTFDFVVLWHVLEHVPNPVEWAREALRILAPYGVVAVEAEFAPLGAPRSASAASPEMGGAPMALTVDDLQRALLAGGLSISKALLETPRVLPAQSHAHQSLALAGVAGARLLAIRCALPPMPAASRWRKRRQGESARRPLISPVPSAPEAVPASEWLDSHFRDAPRAALDFLADAGIQVEGRRMADVGCGDGLIDLGIVDQGRPLELCGFDVQPVDLERLRRWSAALGLPADLPAALHFQESGMRHIPCDDGAFDLIVSWSAFEHIVDPVAILREIRRAVRPDGAIMIQVWPFYRSEHGSHLHRWFPGGFAHLLAPLPMLVEAVRQVSAPHDREIESVSGAHLNRISLDELQRCIVAAHFRITQFQLLSAAAHIPAPLAFHPISELMIGGLMLVAVPE